MCTNTYEKQTGLASPTLKNYLFFLSIEKQFITITVYLMNDLGEEPMCAHNPNIEEAHYSDHAWS
jgi:hypothetical protein